MTERVFLEGNDLERYTIFQITRTYWKSFEDKVAAGEGGLGNMGGRETRLVYGSVEIERS